MLEKNIDERFDCNSYSPSIVNNSDYKIVGSMS